MKQLFSLITASCLLGSPLAFAKDKAMDESIAEAMKAHMLEHGYLELEDDFEGVGKLFKDAKIYRVWVRNAEKKSSSRGLALAVLTQGSG